MNLIVTLVKKHNAKIAKVPTNSHRWRMFLAWFAINDGCDWRGRSTNYT